MFVLLIRSIYIPFLGTDVNNVCFKILKIVVIFKNKKQLFIQGQFICLSKFYPFVKTSFSIFFCRNFQIMLVEGLCYVRPYRDDGLGNLKLPLTDRSLLFSPVIALNCTEKSELFIFVRVNYNIMFN